MIHHMKVMATGERYCVQCNKMFLTGEDWDKHVANYTGKEEVEADKIKAVEVKFKSGAASSKCPNYHLIPRGALNKLADVYRLGIDRKGDAAWNVYSSQEALGDREFILDRISHIIKHALIYRDKLVGKIDWEDPAYKEDDAAAIMWGGSLLAEAQDYKDRPK